MGDFLSSVGMGGDSAGLAGQAFQTMIAAATGGFKGRPQWRDLQFMNDAQNRLWPDEIKRQGQFLEGLAPSQAKAYNTYQDSTYQADVDRKSQGLLSMAKQTGMTPWELAGEGGSAAPIPSMGEAGQQQGSSQLGTYLQGLIPLQVAKTQAATQLATTRMQTDTQKAVAGVQRETSLDVAQLNTATQRDVARIQTEASKQIAGWNNETAIENSKRAAETSIANTATQSATQLETTRMHTSTSRDIANQATAGGAVAEAQVAYYAAQVAVARANSLNLTTHAEISQDRLVMDSVKLIHSLKPDMESKIGNQKVTGKVGWEKDIETANRSRRKQSDVDHTTPQMFDYLWKETQRLAKEAAAAGKKK